MDVHVDYSKGASINGIELFSKSVVNDVGNKENKIKSDLKLKLEKINGSFPLAISTFNYCRRMEREEILKKHYKPNKVELTNYVKAKK